MYAGRNMALALVALVFALIPYVLGTVAREALPVYLGVFSPVLLYLATPPHRAPRWSHRRRMEVALRLLTDPCLDVLIGGESDFDELPDAMERLSRKAGALCHRIRYPTDNPSERA